jgi:hypothetical protein
MELGKIQQCILVLSALKNNFQNDLNVIKRYIHDDDLKYSIANKILVDIASFLDEWKVVCSLAAENIAIRETLAITAPAIRRIKKWEGVKGLRNTALAHGFRDDSTGGQITCLNKRYFNANVPTTYAEIMLLAEFAVYAISTVLCRHKDEHKEAMVVLSKEVFDASVVRGIQTMLEFNAEIKSLQESMFLADPKLKVCFGIES